MTIRHLKIFAEVAKYKKMSLAATKLYITQPTVSQAISELEQHYNVKLFERYPKGLCLTEAGKIMLKYTESVLMAYENLDSTMEKMINTHTINIGATVTCGTCLIDDIIWKMEKSNPEIKSYVIVNNTETIEEKILSNKIDIALVEGVIKNPDIHTRAVIDDYLVLVCSNKHPFANQTSITLDELSTQNFILREQGSGTRELFVNFMASHDKKFNIVWECNNSEAIKKAVMSNRGLTVISIRLVADEIRQGKVHIVNVKNCMWKRQFSLAYHKNKFVSPEIELFIKATEEYTDEIDNILPSAIRG